MLTEVVRQDCFLAVAAIRVPLRHVRREITRFYRRGTATEILRGPKFKVDFLKIWKHDFVQILIFCCRRYEVATSVSITPKKYSCSSQWGLNPQTSNPHNSGPEVDIDFVPTAFFIVPRGLKT